MRIPQNTGKPRIYGIFYCQTMSNYIKEIYQNSTTFADVILYIIAHVSIERQEQKITPGGDNTGGFGDKK